MREQLRRPGWLPDASGEHDSGQSDAEMNAPDDEGGCALDILAFAEWVGRDGRDGEIEVLAEIDDDVGWVWRRIWWV